MNFADLKEKIMEALNPYWEKIQESEAYIQLREKFESYPPKTQKVLIASFFGFIIFLFLYMFPLAYLDSASESIVRFEENQDLIRRLLDVNRELKRTPQLPPAPSSEQLKSMVQTRVMSQGLIPEQMGPVEPTTINMGPLGPKDLTIDGLNATFKQLNLTQLVSLGFDLQTLNNSVKLVAMKVQANPQDSHYFDVTYTLAAFNIPQPKAVIEEEPKKPPPGRRRPRAGDGSGGEN